MPLGRSNLNLQYENKVYGSMLLLLDHVLLRNGGYSSKNDIRFYEDSETEWANQYTYTSPYKQFAYDVSLGIGAPGFSHGGGTAVSTILNKGSVIYSTKPSTTPTATGFVKDVNVYSASTADDEIIFDSHHFAQMNTGLGFVPTKGIPFDDNPYPGVWLKNNGGYEEPYAFGGRGAIAQSVMNLRAICVADNSYTLDAIISIFKSLQDKGMPLVSESYSLTNDQYGGWDGTGIWDYTGAAHTKDGPLIRKVNASRISRSGPTKTANPNSIAGIVDFDVLYWKNYDYSNVGYDANSYGIGNMNFSGTL